MPQRRNWKSNLLDAVVFMGLLAIVGHLALNVWERFVIQKELTIMKSSLYSLKDTVSKIGYAYDNLHRQLTGLARIADYNQTEKSEKKNAPTNEKQPLDKITQNNFKIKKINNVNKYSNTPELLSKMIYSNNSFKREDFENIYNENVSTLTSCPMKSIGVGVKQQCEIVCHRNNCKNYNLDKFTKNCNEHNCRNYAKS